MDWWSITRTAVGRYAVRLDGVAVDVTDTRAAAEMTRSVRAEHRSTWTGRPYTLI